MAAQVGCKMCLVGAIAAVLGDCHALAQASERATGVGINDGETVGEEHERDHIWVAGSLGGLGQTLRGGYGLVS